MMTCTLYTSQYRSVSKEITLPIKTRNRID